MKLGNFVGQGYLAFSDEEVKKITDLMASDLKEAVGDIFEEPIIENKLDGFVTHAFVRFPFKDKRQFRNIYGARVTPNYLYFFFTKHTGYLEVKDKDGKIIKKDWKNAPEFSYGCTFDVAGQYIRYKGRRNIQFPWHGYTYGTEIPDLKIDSDKIKNLVDYLSKLKEGQLRRDDRSRYYWW